MSPSQREKVDELDPLGLRANTGYMPIEHYGLIGNMHTSALVATDGGLDFMCWPHFDSPAVFCRMLDKDRGGHFSITPNARHVNGILTTKQQYLPSSNILQTTYLNDEGVMKVIDFFPRPKKHKPMEVRNEDITCAPQSIRHAESPALRKWLVRRVECVRGETDFTVRVLPAFNYARDKHTARITKLDSSDPHEAPQICVFESRNLSLELHTIIDKDDEDDRLPEVVFEKVDGVGLGDAVQARVHLKEGQRCSFILKEHGKDSSSMTTSLIDGLQQETKDFWFSWLAQSKYRGRWQEVVHRSLLILKLLTYEPTGAIVAAPTFSLPEEFGGGRNWDYRFTWVRDASFTIYILLRLGFRQEAEAFMSFISDRLRYSKTQEGALPIMFSIHGDIDLPEIELDHLDGHRGSKPVRIGNGAATHTQLDIYGELMDAVYLYNKYGKPISYDSWLAIREMIDFVCKVWQKKDMSIWEVRGEIQNFTYSKIMLWVAVDRALRLADKRNFPCPQRSKWLETRDQIMEEAMEKGYNHKMQSFIQSYEHPEALDSACLIAPLVFFVAPNDPRFINTLNRIFKSPEQGGLTSNGLVYRYNLHTSDDGLAGDEGAFSMCTFWMVEALTRAGAYEEQYLDKAVTLFENVLGYANHLGMFSEEISKSGEQLGNTPQAFSHLALISAAFNLDRVTKGHSW